MHSGCVNWVSACYCFRSNLSEKNTDSLPVLYPVCSLQCNIYFPSNHGKNPAFQQDFHIIFLSLALVEMFFLKWDVHLPHDIINSTLLCLIMTFSYLSSADKWRTELVQPEMSADDFNVWIYLA